jgi:3-deoxy-7-phosphoheptulonate synthase
MNLSQRVAARVTEPWTPSAWRGLPIRQQPDWPDPALVRAVGWELAGRPGLVRTAEAFALRRALRRVARGQGFVIQAGDCAETFAGPEFAEVAGRVGLLHRSTRRLADALRVPVVPIGQIAGQYGKPRSSAVERFGTATIPSFRGVIVNDPEPVLERRIPDPMRMLRAYEHSAEIFAMLRELAATGAAMSGFRGSSVPAVWTSHEALLLDYEEPFARHDPESDTWVLTTTHLPWIGARTADPGGAHVRFLAGVVNPIGCKVGPSCTPELLTELCDRLDPDRAPGRLVLVARFGAAEVGRRLPALVRTVAGQGHSPVWLCDPMHGNTISVAGRKVRRVDDIIAELTAFVAAMRAAGGWPGGVHLETTPADVTECLGGLAGVTEAELPLRYTTVCDPRLNGSQTDEVVDAVAALCAPEIP